MTGQETIAVEVDRVVTALAGARSPSEVFRALLEGSGMAAPRSSIFLCSRGMLQGWGCAGHGPDCVERLRTLSLPADEGWLGRVAAAPEIRVQPLAPGERVPEFGQPPPQEAVAIPVRAGQRTVAVLLAERARSEEPWAPELLRAFATVAEIRLDLELMARRVRAGAPLQAEPEEAAPRAPGAGGGAERTALEPAAATPPADRGGQRAAAERLARLIATEIRLYNEEAVLLGRRLGDLQERLQDQLTRGRETFARRYAGLGPVGIEILHEAYVQVLAGGDRSLLRPTESRG